MPPAQGAFFIQKTYPMSKQFDVVVIGGGPGGSGGYGNCGVRFGGGGGGGGGGNPGSPGGPGNPGSAGNPSTFNAVTVVGGCSYPITVASGGQIVVSWCPQ